MSSFHQATTTRLASLAAVSSSEDSAISIACTALHGWVHCYDWMWSIQEGPLVVSCSPAKQARS